MSMSAARSGPSHALLLGTCLVAGLVCYGLGIWQLARLGQRKARNALTVERMALAPADLAGALNSTEDQAYRRVHTHGRFDAGAAVYLTSRSNDDVAGMHVVSPFWAEGAELAVLVNLGWVPVETADSALPSSWIPDGDVDLEGILRTTQTEPAFTWLADPTASPGGPPRLRWRVLSIPGIQAQTPYPLAGYYLALTEPASELQAPLPAPEIDLSEGPHLGYAIQWFAFGTTAIFGGFAWVRSVRRKASELDAKTGPTP
jgi:surfeit locus 1 family protein